ncbi:hypothetical protein [Microbacterium rhizophilus]
MDVTCTTEGCLNKGRTISVPDSSDVVICGPCGAQLVGPEEPA